ncbi:uncharacterized protein ACNLHF_007078 [Anomaloglossus baeobatrachus]
MSTKSTVNPSASETHHVPDTEDAAGAESALTAEQNVRPKRVSKPTQKVRENLETTRDKFHDNLEHLWGKIGHYLAVFPRSNSDAAELTATLNRLSAAYDRYQRLSARYITFLSTYDMENAPTEIDKREALLKERASLVQDAQNKAELRITHLQEARSCCTTSAKVTSLPSRSSHSRKSTLSDKLLELRAAAEEARVKSSFAKKEAEVEAEAQMEDQRNEREAERNKMETQKKLKILQAEKEEATALAKLKILEQVLGQDHNSDCLIPGEMEDSVEHTIDYLLRHLTTTPAPPPFLNTDASAG